MTEKEIKLFIKKLEGHQEEAATLRDKIRDVLDELNELKEDLGEAEDQIYMAIERLEDAADAISRTV